MRVSFADHHEVPLPPKHRFPMRKYRMLRETLVARGLVEASWLTPSGPVDREALEAVHDPRYVEAFLAGTLPEDAVRRIGFPWSESLVRRCLASVAGTVAAAGHALVHGIAGNLAGGTHHAHADFGAGYCVFNDIAVAARGLLARREVARVLVVDLDVHQGDGTAAIFAGDPAVFTVSVHGAGNFPLRKRTSDLDVALPDGTTDDDYLAAVDDAWRRSTDALAPDIVFFQAGVDPLAEDRLGRLALTHDGLRRRDALVLRRCRDAGTPVVLTLGGGYADPIEASVEAHAGTYAVAREVFA